jgi:hypothetical protein
MLLAGYKPVIVEHRISLGDSLAMPSIAINRHHYWPIRHPMDLTFPRNIRSPRGVLTLCSSLQRENTIALQKHVSRKEIQKMGRTKNEETHLLESRIRTNFES